MPATSNFDRDPRIDAYIGGLPQWQQEICEELRTLIYAIDPEMAETVKRRDRPYFVLRGNVCALLAAKDHVNRRRAEAGCGQASIAAMMLATFARCASVDVGGSTSSQIIAKPLAV